MPETPPTIPSESLFRFDTDERSKETWRKVTFGDVARCMNETTTNPQAQGLQRVVGLEHIDPEDLRIKRWASIDDGTSFTRVFRSGQVLFGKRRAYQRKVALADFDGICSGDILVFEARPDVLLPDLLPFLVQTTGFFQHALGTSAGSLSPRTKWSDLASYEFFLPPIQEQESIAKILIRLEETISYWQTVSHNLFSLWQSIVNSEMDTVIGQITTISDLMNNGILAAPQDGNHGELHPKASNYIELGIPFIMANNVRSGKIDFVNCKHLPQTLTDSLRIGFAIEGDVLMTHKGTVGEVALVPKIEWDYIMLTPQVTAYRILDRSRLDPQYLALQLNTTQTKSELRRLASNGMTCPRYFSPVPTLDSGVF